MYFSNILISENEQASWAFILIISKTNLRGIVLEYKLVGRIRLSISLFQDCTAWIFLDSFKHNDFDRNLSTFNLNFSFQFYIAGLIAFVTNNKHLNGEWLFTYLNKSEVLVNKWLLGLKCELEFGFRYSWNILYLE